VEVIDGRLDGELVCIRIDPGELFLETLKQVIEEKRIKAGVVISGIGSMSVCRIHVVNAGYPPNLLTRKQDYYEYKGSIEVLALQGIIANGEPHLHITVADENQNAHGGHVENGCVVLTMAEVVILRADTLPARRELRFREKLTQLTYFEGVTP